MFGNGQGGGGGALRNAIIFYDVLNIFFTFLSMKIHFFGDTPNLLTTMCHQTVSDMSLSHRRPGMVFRFVSYTEEGSWAYQSYRSMDPIFADVVGHHYIYANFLTSAMLNKMLEMISTQYNLKVNDFFKYPAPPNWFELVLKVFLITFASKCKSFETGYSSYTMVV